MVPQRSNPVLPVGMIIVVLALSTLAVMSHREPVATTTSTPPVINDSGETNSDVHGKRQQSTVAVEPAVSTAKASGEELMDQRLKIEGVIQNVDDRSEIVWINLGSEDNIKPRTIFSVWGKEIQEIDRDATDMKGKIEVTRILHSHFAEARIVAGDPLRPMVAEDRVSLSKWSPPTVNRVSVIGRIRLDGEGKFDRDEFKKILLVSGAVIDNEVDDDGNRSPADGKITAQTHYLVIGEILDLDEASNEREKAIAIRTRDHLKSMLLESAIHNVPVVELSSFLSHGSSFGKRPIDWNQRFGFEDKRRTVDGIRPELIKKRRNGPKPIAPGATSKLFNKK